MPFCWFLCSDARTVLFRREPEPNLPNFDNFAALNKFVNSGMILNVMMQVGPDS